MSKKILVSFYCDEKYKAALDNLVVACGTDLSTAIRQAIKHGANQYIKLRKAEIAEALKKQETEGFPNDNPIIAATKPIE